MATEQKPQQQGESIQQSGQQGRGAQAGDNTQMPRQQQAQQPARIFTDWASI